MPKKRKHHAVPQIRRRHALPFNFVSGIIYATAAILSIALGGLFYKGYRDSLRTPLATPSRANAPQPDIPFGSPLFIRIIPVF